MEGADLVVGHLKKVKRLSRDSRFRFCLLDIGQDQDIAVMSAAANVRAGVGVGLSGGWHGIGNRRGGACSDH